MPIDRLCGVAIVALILALTAATVSSRAVCDIVNQTVAAVCPQLGAAPTEEAK